MAQYGKSLFSTSPYGYKTDANNRIYGGVFVGEFLSDETSIHYSVTELNAPVHLKSTLSIPWAEYKASTSNSTKEWQFEEGWNVLSSYSEYSRAAAGLYKSAYLTATLSDFKIEFTSRSTANVTIKVFDMKYDSDTKTVSISATPSRTIDVNTNTTKTVEVKDLPYSEKVIQICHKTDTTGVISINNLKAKTANVAFEFRRKYKTSVWEPWVEISTTNTKLDDLSNQYTATVSSSGETSKLNGYQFRLILMSSDNLVAPSVTKLEISIGNTSKYDDEGLYRMLIDLESFGGHAVKEVKSIECTFTDECTHESNKYVTKCEVRSATTDNSPDVNIPTLWSAWTPPYGLKTDRRAQLNVKDVPDLKEGFIITNAIRPVINSTNSNYNKIISWKDIYVHYNLQEYNPLDPKLSRLNNQSMISIECVKNDANKTQIPIKKNENGIINKQLDMAIPKNNNSKEIVYVNGINALDISGVSGEDIRFKIILKRSIVAGMQAPSTPYVDLTRVNVNMDYTEKVSFTDMTYNLPQRNYNGYACAIFNQNTGRDYVHVNGKSRDVVGSIPYFNYTLPKFHEDGVDTVVANVGYTISNIKLNSNLSTQVSLYWDTTESKPKAFTTNASSKLKVLATTTYDPDKNIYTNQTVLPTCYQTRHGLTTKIASPDIDSYDIDFMSNMFSPKLKTNKEYAYYVESFSPENVDVLFMNEKSLEEGERLNVSYGPTATVPVSIGINIKSPREGGLVPWFSKEIISETLTVNKNGAYIPKTIIIGDDEGEFPQIPEGITVGAQPYEIEVLKGSVTCDDVHVEDSRITLAIDSIIRKDVDEQYLPMTISGSGIDNLPRSRCNFVEFHADSNGAVGVKLNYQFSIVPDIGESLYGSKISWTGTSKPTAGSKVWVRVKYQKTKALKCSIISDYKEKEYSYANIYRTTPKKFSASVTPTVDYVSNEFLIKNEWEIPSKVDTSSLSIKCQVLNNKNVRCYTKDNKVFATLDRTDSLINWHPDIKKGYYYSEKQEGYLYSSMSKIELDNEHIPIANNIEYVGLSTNNSGVAIQTATTNMLSNSDLMAVASGFENVFVDGFNNTQSQN